MTDQEKSLVAVHLRQAADLRNLCLRLSKAGASGADETTRENPGSGRVAEKAPAGKARSNERNFKMPRRKV